MTAKYLSFGLGATVLCLGTYLFVSTTTEDTIHVTSAAHEQITVQDNDNTLTSAQRQDYAQSPPTSMTTDEHENTSEVSPFDADDSAYAWAKVDLVALQNEMPDNIFWELAAPTQDESVLAERKEAKAYWQTQSARILSNQANEQEIRDFYARKQRVSSDLVSFSTALLNRHAKDLTERDYGLQNLARTLHLARLEEIPQQLAKALDNRKQFEARRATWLSDKASYEAQLALEREAALREMGKI